MRTSQYAAPDGSTARVKLVRAEWLCDDEKRHGAVPAFDSLPADACADDEFLDGLYGHLGTSGPDGAPPTTFLFVVVDARAALQQPLNECGRAREHRRDERRAAAARARARAVS